MSLLSRLAVQAARAYGILSSGRSTNVSASYLAVAGGGSGGPVTSGGGGGAGGYKTSTFTLSTLNTYSITVGAGGASATTGSFGANGSNSVISGTGLTTVTSVGGGGGGRQGGTINGAAGGSGGGGSFQSGTGGAGTSGQGNNGGSHNGAAVGCGAGGGGAGAAGSNITSSSGANGGIGLASSISGSSVYYAGGGGGGSNGGSTGVGTGGTGGGGNGSNNGATVGTAGTVNTGGGGGGAGDATNPTGFAGGSGVVIISYASATPKFVGGTLTTSGGNQIHTFTSSGTLSPLTPVTASYLVVAGGGGAGSRTGGGGGAGGLLTSSTTLYSGATYIVTVGGGGTGGAGSAGNNGTSGSNSVLSGTGLTTITSTGGGYGTGENINTAGSGGSGGGCAVGSTGVGSGTSGQGNNGGTSNPAYGGGAGGGASAVGGNASITSAGIGGAGTASSISGTSVTYAGGGGGGGGNAVGTGGAGGGGNGGTGTSVGSPGTTNLGGGGGGGSAAAGTGYAGGAGGSGIVIISYAGSQVFNGGLVTSSGGNTIHTFNATGALTPLTNNLNNSLRFRSSASAYLNRTATVTGNRQTWTWSSWVKRGTLGARQHLFVSANPVVNTGGQQEFQIAFASADHLEISGGTSGVGNDLSINTTQLFRDPSAWYHIVVAVDTTQATAANRVRLFVNGNQVTAFQAGVTYPTQNYNTSVNLTGFSHRIGGSGGSYLDGYQTDINLVDSQALEPYYFGNNDANGVWKPIKYTGMYGTNGFYLTFGNTTSTTTLGYDSSGNGNNWTTNNISLTAGVTYDAMTDVPTNTSATVANYAVLNPLALGTSQTALTQGNLYAIPTSGASNWGSAFSSIAIPTSGKYYIEATATVYAGSGNNSSLGVVDSATFIPTNSAILYQYTTGEGFDGILCHLFSDYVAPIDDGVQGTNVTGITGTSVNLMLALDVDNGKVYAGYNGTWLNSGNPAGGTGQVATRTFSPTDVVAGNTSYNGTNDQAQYYNFGQRPFTYTPPTGFVALNTYNLPTPTILQGNKYMDATLYTGTGTSQVIVNQGQFKPDFVWIKSRNNITNNNLTDSVRGVTKIVFSNSSNAEATASVGVTSFDNNGFSLATGGDVGFSASGYTYVGWQWQAGAGTTSTNTSGSISSTVSVNSTAGFSVVTYTGTGANATVGHGLGVAPSFTAVKCRNDGTIGWVNYHASLGNTKFLNLNNSNAAATGSTVWNNTSPTSTTIALGTDSAVNGSTKTYVMYAWAEIAGFSKFGSWTNNGSTDGTFIYTGFAPAVILVKSSDAGESWYFRDNKRQTYNMTPPSNIWLQPNASSAEGALGATTAEIDTLSNGFKIRTTNTGSGEISFGSRNYIYAAWAENPFKNANAR